MAETPYTETEALIAVMRGDRERLTALVRDMLPGERATLERQADSLADFLHRWCRKCGGPIAQGEHVTLLADHDGEYLQHRYECPEAATDG